MGEDARRPAGLGIAVELRRRERRRRQAGPDIAGANHYYSGPAQRETLRKAVGICTDWPARHGFATQGEA
jgi:hypothetical protein